MVDGWTAAMCVARIFLFATFMTVASVIPVLMQEWGIGAAEAGAIVTGFTVSYAISLFLFAYAADHLGAKRAVLVSAFMSATASLMFALFATGWLSAFILYALIGLSQGGIYTPLIMLFAERHEPARRGTAMGWLIASTSIGYATSLFVSGIGLALGGWRGAFLVAGTLPFLGTILIWYFLRNEENRIHARTTRGNPVRAAFSNRRASLLTIGYTAHSWELLGGWAWMPSLIAAAYALSGAVVATASQWSAWLTGSMHLVGAVTAFSMGALSDRLGRKTVLVGVAAITTVLSFSLGWLVTIPIVPLVALGLVYSALTIGDSPVLTTAITEVTEAGTMGAMLAMRSLLGFGAGAIAPIVAGLVYDLASAAELAPQVVWGVTFGVLGIGGLIATLSAIGLTRD